MGKKITEAVYDAMVAAYAENQNAEWVAEKTGVNWRTAQRYITEGDEKRGLAPIGQRFIDTARSARKLADRDHADVIAQNVRILDGAIVLAAKQLVPRLRGDAGETPYQATIHELTTMMRAQYRLMGGPSEVIEVRINAIMGVVVMQIDKVMRDLGLEEHTEVVVTQLGESLKALSLEAEAGPGG